MDDCNTYAGYDMEMGNFRAHGWNSVGLGVVRKEADLTMKEKKFLTFVERGDVPSVQKMLSNIGVNKVSVVLSCFNGKHIKQIIE